MNTLGIPSVHPEALATMISRGGNWAAYRNMAMDSVTFGQMQFLQFGKDCTFPDPPTSMPDSQLGIGWKYQHIGTVDLTNGEIIPKE